MKEARASLESQLKRKEEELRKANDSRDNIMKTMREALEVAKANKAEYDVKLATVRQQCREEMRREIDEEMRRTKRDFQKQLDDKDRSLEEAKCVEKTKPVSKTSESSKSSSSSSDPDTEENGATNTLQSRQKRPLKRRSSDLPLAEVRVKMLSAKKGNIVDSDEDFTTGRPRTRNSTRKAARSCSNRSKRTAVTGVDILPTMGENESKIDSRAEKRKLLKDFEGDTTCAEDVKNELAGNDEEMENIAPRSTQSTTKKRGKLFRKPSALSSVLSPAKPLQGDRENSESQDKARNIITRQLRPRVIKYN